MTKKISGKILMIFLPMLILLLAVFLASEMKNKTPPISTKTGEIPTPTPTNIPSRWATDSGVLEIENNLKTISEEIKSVNLQESGLFPPVLDMEIKMNL